MLHHRRAVHRGQGVPRRPVDHRRCRTWTTRWRTASRIAAGHQPADRGPAISGLTERLPRGVRPRGRRADPLPRRHRPGRGSGAGRVRRPRRPRWPTTGTPPSPAGWIITTARNRAIDRLRRESQRGPREAEAALLAFSEPPEEGPVRDDRLRLIFTCCHPALGQPAQVALTLRLLGGLSTPEIARAFLVGGVDDGAAHRPRQEQDPRRRHPVPDPRANADLPGPSAAGPGRSLPDLQRGVRGQLRPGPDPRRSVRRGDPPHPDAGRADAGRAGGTRTTGPDAADRCPAPGPHHCGR